MKNTSAGPCCPLSVFLSIPPSSASFPAEMLPLHPHVLAHLPQKSSFPSFPPLVWPWEGHRPFLLLNLVAFSQPSLPWSSVTWMSDTVAIVLGFSGTHPTSSNVHYLTTVIQVFWLASSLTSLFQAALNFPNTNPHSPIRLSPYSSAGLLQDISPG